MPRSKLKNTLKIILGATNCGHKQWDIIYFRSSLGVNEFNYAYSEGVKATGIDPAKNWCMEYQDTLIPPNELNKLVSLGFKLEEGWFYLDSANPGKYEATPMGFISAILFVASQGSTRLETKILLDKTPTNVVLDKDGIGYGFF